MILAAQKSGDKLAKRLSEDQHLLNYLFELLGCDQTSYRAMQLIEDLFQAMPSVVNLASIGGLYFIDINLHAISDKSEYVCAFL